MISVEGRKDTPRRCRRARRQPRSQLRGVCNIWGSRASTNTETSTPKKLHNSLNIPNLKEWNGGETWNRNRSSEKWPSVAIGAQITFHLRLRDIGRDRTAKTYQKKEQLKLCRLGDCGVRSLRIGVERAFGPTTGGGGLS